MPSFECSWPALPLAPGAAQDAHEAVEQSILPAAQPAPALAMPAPEQTPCAECGELFSAKAPHRPGPPPRYCSAKCRNRTYARAKQERAGARANGGTVPAAPEPVPEHQEHVAPQQASEPAPERPPERPQCAYCEDAFEPTNPEQKYCSRECKDLARADRQGRPTVPGNDKGYVVALQASGGRF